MNPGIVIRGVRFTYQQLIDGDFIPQSDFEKNVVDFTRLWWSDTNLFSLKTSGSTGEPKTIQLTRDQMTGSAHNTIKHLSLEPGDNALICLDPAYIAGKMMLVRCFEGKLNAILSDPKANPLNDISPDTGIDFVALVPLQLQQLVKECRDRLNKIRVVIVGGASVDKHLENEIASLNCDVYSTYGMTETVSHVALQKLNGKGKSQYFEALPGVELATDDRGCLVVKADYLPEEVITNDIVDLADQRHFIWKGRVDNVVNSGGIKISPEIIEQKLSLPLQELESAAHYFLGGVPDEKLGQKLCLFLEASSLHLDRLEKLKASAEKILSKYEVPKEIRLIDQFYRTPTGKINRKETIYLSPVQIHKWIRRG
ncbi:MAG TPA: AMP-binding protein [Cyclobacteriaceae bacterium]|nr:AMP-binding protein [Cyclobacteriaceae bacterium]